MAELIRTASSVATISPKLVLTSGLDSAEPVWRPPSPLLVINGDLVTKANVVVANGQHDLGVLFVLGNVRCRNLATAGDSATYVDGVVRAELLN